MGASVIAQGRNFRSMLSFFRRSVASPWGAGLLGLILVAFVVTLYDANTFGGSSLTGSGGGLATVGGTTLAEGDVRRRIQTQFDAARQQQPDLDMAAFVNGGGLDRTLDQLINGLTLEQFAARQGMVASDKLVDGSIASIAAFNGPTGKFDPAVFRSILAQRKIPEKQLREDFAREALTKMLLTPVTGAAQMSPAMVNPYASLLLEARAGQIGIVPSVAFANMPPPNDAAVNQFYTRNVARYTLPERRIVKYALFDRSRFEGKVAPSDAEITKFYTTNAPAYAAKETRAFTQIILPTRAQADTVLAKIKAGTPMADAARAVNRSTLPVAATDRAAFEKLTDPRVAAAAFAAPQGQFANIAQSGLGFHIVRVDAVATTRAKPLAEVRATIVGELTQQKMDEAVTDFVAKLDDEVADGATFDEVAKKYALTVATTPAVTAAGLAPDQPGFKAPPELSIILRDAFAAEVDDAASVAQLGAGRNFALLKLDRVVAAAPRPLAQIRDQVVADARLDAASKAARKIADAVAASVNRGTPIAQAIAATGVRLPPLRPAGGKRIEIAQAGDRVPPPLALMFSMGEKRARVLGMPNNEGWFIVYLDKIDRGNAAANPALIEATREQLARVVTSEYAEQFVGALRAQIGAKRDAAAIAQLRASLSGAPR